MQVKLGWGLGHDEDIIFIGVQSMIRIQDSGYTVHEYCTTFQAFFNFQPFLDLHGKEFHQQGWVLLHLAVEFRAGQVPSLLCHNLHHHLLSSFYKLFVFRTLDLYVET